MAAIMKGWIDRVFVSGLCYGGRRICDRGGLKGKSAMLAVSLCGRQHMFGEGAVHGDLEIMLRPILRGTLAYVGLTVLAPFVAYHVPYIRPEQGRQIRNCSRGWQRWHSGDSENAADEGADGVPGGLALQASGSGDGSIAGMDARPPG